MRAVVLAGGRGTRLRPYTTVLPKPLMPLGDHPILEIIVRQLSRQGFERITVSTGYLAELIEAYFQDGHRWGLAMDYCREDRPLGTAGGLRRIVEPMAEDFLVMNGDILAALDYGALLRDHIASQAAATVAVAQRDSQVEFGVAEIGPDGDLTGWTEKPVHTHAVGMGVYALSPAVIDLIKPEESIGMPDLLLRVLSGGERVRCHVADCYWLDIGRVNDYQRAQDDFERMRPQFLGEQEE